MNVSSMKYCCKFLDFTLWYFFIGKKAKTVRSIPALPYYYEKLYIFSDTINFIAQTFEYCPYTINCIAQNFHCCPSTINFIAQTRPSCRPELSQITIDSLLPGYGRSPTEYS